MKTIRYLFIAFFPPLFSQGQELPIIEKASGATVFFNQDLYVPGDTAFFKVLLLPSLQLPLDGEQLLHIDLINKSGIIIFKQNIKVKEGGGGNQLILPNPLAPGAYIFNLSVNGVSHSIWSKPIMVAGEKRFTINSDTGGANQSPQNVSQQNSIEILGVSASYFGRQKVDVKIDTHRPNDEFLKSNVGVRVTNLKVASLFSPQNLVAGKPNGVNVSKKRNSRGSKVDLNTKLVWQGKVLYKGTNTPVPDSTHVAIFLQKSMMGYDFYALKEGRFSISSLFDFYETDKLFVLAEYKGKELPIDLAIDQQEVSSLHAPVLSLTENREWYSEFSMHKGEVDRAFYFSKENLDKGTTESNSGDLLEDEFQKPDITVRISEYLIFPTIEEIIREIIPSLSVKRNEDDLRLKMNLLISLDNPVASKETPLLIIDGVMTKDVNFFLGMKPADVISIKLIRKMNKLLPWGLLGKDGVVFVTTKNPLVAKEIVAYYPEVKGLTKALPFYTKNYSIPGNPLIPDFRTTLYWNAELPIDETGKATFSFYTADSLGEFIIQLEGETVDGQSQFGTKPFSVLFKPKD